MIKGASDLHFAPRCWSHFDCMCFSLFSLLFICSRLCSSNTSRPTWTPDGGVEAEPLNEPLSSGVMYVPCTESATDVSVNLTSFQHVLPLSDGARVQHEHPSTSGFCLLWAHSAFIAISDDSSVVTGLVSTIFPSLSYDAVATQSRAQLW